MKKRIPCEIQVGEDWRSGLVLDVSPEGLFVQAGGVLAPGTEVEVRLRLPDRPEPVSLRAVVARARRAPRRLASVVKPGVGLRVRVAPNTYYEFVADLSPESGLAAPLAPATPPAPSPPAARFRVRVQQVGGPRSRTLTLGADSAEDAAERALQETGPDWRVLEVEPA